MLFECFIVNLSVKYYSLCVKKFVMISFSRKLCRYPQLLPYNWYEPYDLTLLKIAIWLSKNCQKLDIFWKKIAKNFHFFKKNCQWQFFWKISKFLAIFFWKNVKFLAIFWHSNGNFPEGQFLTKCFRISLRMTTFSWTPCSSRH